MKYKSVSALLAVILIQGCTVTIAQLRDDPSRYGRQEVGLTGRVMDVFPIPLTDVSIYILQDDTGEIPILSFRVPRKDSRITIRGKLVYFSGKDTVDNVEDVVDTITDSLVDNDIMERKGARALSTRIVEIIGKMIGSRKMTFFVVESVERERA